MMVSPQFPLTEDNEALARRLQLTSLDDIDLFPKYFEIETVNACNARCPMCTINDWEKKKDVFMADALYEKFVGEVGNYSDWIIHITLNRDGEPTLDKSLPEKVRMLKDVGIKKVTFATNGQRLTPEFSARLLDAGLDDIMVSIDGITKETFEAVRVRLNFERVVENTMALIELRNERKAPLTIALRMLIMPETAHEVDDWLAYWNARIAPQDRAYATPIHTWGNQLGSEAKEKIEMYKAKPCIAPFSSMVVHNNGIVGLCSIDYKPTHVMGDLKAQSIKEIWTSEAFTNVREVHANRRRNDITMCRGCDIWERDHVMESGSIDPGALAEPAAQ